jgi:hypothetical protein
MTDQPHKARLEKVTQSRQENSKIPQAGLDFVMNDVYKLE